MIGTDGQFDFTRLWNREMITLQYGQIMLLVNYWRQKDAGGISSKL